jgi:hypothetical protein
VISIEAVSPRIVCGFFPDVVPHVYPLLNESVFHGKIVQNHGLQKPAVFLLSANPLRQGELILNGI